MKNWLCLLGLIFLSVSTQAQRRLSEHNTIGWYATTVTPKISDKVSAHIEYQWRRDNVIKDWQQSLLRLGINYKVHPQATLHIGYGWIETFPYGTYSLGSVSKRFPEHRIYQQLVVNAPVGKVNLAHRLRLEQRWIGRFNTAAASKPDEYIFLNRARYMPRVDIPLSDKWNASVFDEIFIGFGKNIGENIFDQNRIGVLMGYKVNKNLKLEGGFINQTVQLGREINNKNVFQYNNGILINTIINL